MTIEDRVVALFAAENPIPLVEDLDYDDFASHLAVLKKRSSEMSDLDTKAGAGKNLRRPLYWLMAAIIVAVGGVGAVLISQDSGPSPVAPATTGPLPSSVSPSTLSTVDLVSMAISSIETWNTGDFAAWEALFAADHGEDLIFSEALMKGGRQIALTGECVPTSIEAGETYIDCLVSVDDDFHGAGNVTDSGVMTFRFGNDGLLLGTSDTLWEDDSGNKDDPEWAEFNFAFNTWLAGAYPEVFAMIGPEENVPMWYLPGYASGNPDDMLIALQYVDEFVTQSDRYPLP